MSLPVWLVAAPSGTGGEGLSKLVDNCKSMCSKDYPPQKFDVPDELKYQGFNDLVKLGDDLAKYDSEVESALRRIERQIAELDPDTSTSALQIFSQGVAYDWKKYVSNFKWDDAKFPRTRPLKETLEYLMSTVQTLDESVRSRGQGFVDLKNQVANSSKKDVATLVTKDLIDLLTPDVVKTEDFVETEHITTACVVVPRGQEKAWQATYENPSAWLSEPSALEFEVVMDRSDGSAIRADLEAEKTNLRVNGFAADGLVSKWNQTFPSKEVKVGDLIVAVNGVSSIASEMMKEIQDPSRRRLDDKLKLKVRRSVDVIKQENLAIASKLKVVPRSTKQFPGTDKDFNTLWRVMVFRDSLEVYKKMARDKKYLVRDFTYSAAEYQKLAESRVNQEAEITKQEQFLIKLCKASFSDTVINWMHLKAIRVFVEAVLRFGSSANFAAFALEPAAAAKTKMLHAKIQTAFGPSGYGQKFLTNSAAGQSEEHGEEFFPYVFLPFSVVA